MFVCVFALLFRLLLMAGIPWYRYFSRTIVLCLYWCYLVLNTLSTHLSSPAADSFQQLPTALTLAEFSTNVKST
jgi:hypothetical protein